MSYKHVGTAADLVRFGCALKVECTACGAAHTMSSIEVYRVQARGRLERLVPRLKCRRCGSKAAKIYVLDPVYPH